MSPKHDVCHSCGSPMERDSNFCIMCGTPRPKGEKKCPSCDQPIHDGDIFCGNCGYRIKGASSNVRAHLAPEEEAKLQRGHTKAPITLSELMAIPPKLPNEGIVVRQKGTGTVFGPGSLDRIIKYIKQKKINGQDTVGIGDGRWFLISEHPQLQAFLGAEETATTPEEVIIDLAAPSIEPETKKSNTVVTEKEKKDLPLRPNLIPSDNIYIYLIDSKKEMGPMSYATLVKYIRNGTLAKHDYIYSTNNKWTSFRELLKSS